MCICRHALFLFAELIFSAQADPHSRKCAYKHFSMYGKVSILAQLALLCKQSQRESENLPRRALLCTVNRLSQRKFSGSALRIDFGSRCPFQLSMDGIVDVFSFSFALGPLGTVGKGSVGVRFLSMNLFCVWAR